jgi:hypothetical protein
VKKEQWPLGQQKTKTNNHSYGLPTISSLVTVTWFQLTTYLISVTWFQLQLTTYLVPAPLSHFSYNGTAKAGSNVTIIIITIKKKRMKTETNNKED